MKTLILTLLLISMPLSAFPMLEILISGMPNAGVVGGGTRGVSPPKEDEKQVLQYDDDESDCD